jgi:hypothetical protein
MSEKTETEFYDNEIRRLIEALRAKGPDELTRALLIETEEAGKLISAKPDIHLSKADSVLHAVRDRLDGRLSTADCTARGEALTRDLRAIQALGLRKRSRALLDYQTACAKLPTVETNEDSPYFTALYLVNFGHLWTGYSLAVARREQLDHLQAALESRPIDSLPAFGQRNRNSLLAE